MNRCWRVSAVSGLSPPGGKFARRNKRGFRRWPHLVLFFLVLLGSGVGWAVRDRAAREAEAAQQKGARQGKVAGQVEPDPGRGRPVGGRAEVDRGPGSGARTGRGGRWQAARPTPRPREQGATGKLRDLQMVARLEDVSLTERYVYAGRGTAHNEGRPDPLRGGVSRLWGERRNAPPGGGGTAARSTGAGRRPGRGPGRLGRQGAPASPRPVETVVGSLSVAVDPDPWRVSVRHAAAVGDRESLVRLANAPDTARHPPQSQFLISIQLRRFDQLELALGLLERACEIHPSDFWIHYELASNSRLVRPARLEAALRHGIAARALRPRSAGTGSNLGQVLQDQKKLDEAITCFKKAIEVDPNHVPAHVNLANLLLGKPEEAITHYRKAIELDPNFADAYFNLGNTLRDQFVASRDPKKRSEAIACYKKAIEIDPKHAGVYINLGNALANREELEERIVCYKKAIEIDPAYDAPYFNLRQTLRGTGLGIAHQTVREQKEAEAIAWFRGVAERNTTVPEAHIQLARLLKEHGKLDEATAACRAAINHLPKNADACNKLGATLCDDLKAYDSAIECFRTATKLDPKHPYASRNLGYALTQKGWDLVNRLDPKRRDPKRALEAVQEAVQLATQDGMGWQRTSGVDPVPERRLAGQHRGGAEKSCKLQQGGRRRRRQLIVLALAHARLAAQEGLPDKEREHHKAAARRWFDQADKQIDSWLRVRPGDLVGQAIWDFRAEAREMIGTNDSKK